MDASSSSVPNDLPYFVWRDGCDGLALHAIRQSKSVSDDTSRLSDGVFGRDLPIPSGSEHGHLGARSLCRQADCVVLLLRVAVARVLGSCEATRAGIPMDLVRVGDSEVAVGRRLEVRGRRGGERSD